MPKRQSKYCILNSRPLQEKLASHKLLALLKDGCTPVLPGSRNLSYICGICLLPAGIYLFKVRDGNIRTICKTCSKLKIKIKAFS